MAIPAYHLRMAVQAGLFLSFGLVGHLKIFLKNRDKRLYSQPFIKYRTGNDYFWLMKLVSFLLLFTCLSSLAGAQYYYKDIVGSRETADMLKIYMQHKVQKVVLVSYDADGMRTENFNVMQQVSYPEKKMTTITSTGGPESILVTYFNSEGLVEKTVDSSLTLVTVSTYQYNNDKQLSSFITRSADSSGSFVQTEEHKWEYKAGKPLQMIKLKNGKQTEVVKFKLDVDGQVIEEQSFIGGKGAEPVQYFYDGAGHLTDIVRFNVKAGKLLPEYLFEYSPSNQLLQKITVPSNNSNYLIWRYQYDERGLKIREAVFDKQKRLNGKIEYQYSFG